MESGGGEDSEAGEGGGGKKEEESEVTRSSQVRSSEDSALNITTSQSGALTEAETEVGSQPDLENSAEDTEGEAGNSDSEELQQLRLGDGEEADGPQHQRDTAGAQDLQHSQ